MLHKEKIYLESDNLSIGKTKTIGYITHIHLQVANRTHTKNNIQETLNDIHISHEEALKYDHTLKEGNEAMIEEGDTPVIHCPAFEDFQTTIGISNGTKHLETYVIGIKCKSSKAALLREFLLRATPNLETNGIGKFIAAGLANVIGSDTMKTLI